MTTLRVRIETEEQMIARLSESVDAARSNRTPVPESSYTFPDWETLHRTLTPKRLAIVQAMAGQGALTMREVARRVGRDFKAVHGDVTALLLVGILDKSEGGVIFPYDRIYFEFEIDAAA